MNGWQTKLVAGDRVVVQNTLFYNGHRGVLQEPVGSFWDLDVRLDSGELIGVESDQVRRSR